MTNFSKNTHYCQRTEEVKLKSIQGENFWISSLTCRLFLSREILKQEQHEQKQISFRDF